MAKHGVENLTFYVVQECSSKAEGLQAEIEWIARLSSNHIGYNLTAGGDGCSHEWTAEHRQAQSLRLTGRKLHAEVKQRVGQALRKHWSDPENRAKRVQSCNPILKPIAQCDTEGNVIRVFASLCEAAVELGTSAGNLSSAATGRRPTCMGFRWKYVIDQSSEQAVVSTHGKEIT